MTGRNPYRFCRETINGWGASGCFAGVAATAFPHINRRGRQPRFLPEAGRVGRFQTVPPSPAYPMQ